MDMKPIDRRRSAALDLSKAEAFRLGSLAVDPALRTLGAGERAIVRTNAGASSWALRALLRFASNPSPTA